MGSNLAHDLAGMKDIEIIYQARSLIEDKEIQIKLIDIAGFLDGLIVEGRI